MGLSESHRAGIFPVLDRIYNLAWNSPCLIIDERSRLSVYMGMSKALRKNAACRPGTKSIIHSVLYLLPADLHTKFLWSVQLRFNVILCKENRLLKWRDIASSGSAAPVMPSRGAVCEFRTGW